MNSENKDENPSFGAWSEATGGISCVTRMITDPERFGWKIGLSQSSLLCHPEFPAESERPVQRHCPLSNPMELSILRSLEVDHLDEIAAMV